MSKKLLFCLAGLLVSACLLFGCSNEPPHSAGRVDRVTAVANAEWQQRNRTELPPYFKTQLKQKLWEAKQLYEENKATKELLVFFTDYHIEENQGFSPLLLKEIQKELPLSMIVFGGDIYDVGPAKEQARQKMQAFKERFAFCGDSWQEIIGNHEYNGAFGNSSERPGELLNAAYLQQLLLTKQLAHSGSHDEYGDYWIDKGDMRYFFLGAARNITLRDQQYQWLFAELAKVPDGKNVLLFSHLGCNDKGPRGVIHSSFLPVAQALGALKAGKDFTWQGQRFPYAGKKVTVVGCLTGHVHHDDMLTESNVKVVATCADTLRFVPDSPNVRKPGTVSEQVLDIVVLDKAKHEVQLIRIGHGQNRSFQY